MSSPPRPDDSARAAAKALKHAIRREFIHGLIAADGPVAPSTHADEKGLPVSSVSYHVRVLTTLGVVEAVESVKRRASTESRYRLGGPNCHQALTMLPVVDQIAARRRKQ
ncbi:MAG TPA: hypothetical protein VHA54_11830 [Solirubrobacterales bacterium]|nr:hypothetical protein [Solirubrobacterales bacterium]